MRIQRRRGFYEVCIKRLLDIICSIVGIVCFSWLYVIIAVIVRVKLGSPVIFKQPRPGMVDYKSGQEKIFWMYKFRSMDDKRDSEGELLPDEERLPAFGKKLRDTSLDELPELFNILKGDMSIIGPRPQLVRDMVFMSDEQRMRHTAKPGLSGLAQIMGRNAISWEEKFEWDLKYIDKVNFGRDLEILFLTIKKVFGKNESSDELDVTLDYGDWLLKEGRVSQEKYDVLQEKAIKLIGSNNEKYIRK